MTSNWSSPKVTCLVKSKLLAPQQKSGLVQIENSMNVGQKMAFLFSTVEHFVEKGESAGYQYFLYFLQCFQGILSQGC